MGVQVRERTVAVAVERSLHRSANNENEAVRPKSLMANPRQRRKARSNHNHHKPVHHSRQAKKLLKKQPPIHGPKILQEAWDKHKTVRQNYAALGLAVSLNSRAPGGAECAVSVTEARTSANEATFINGPDTPKKLMSGRRTHSLLKNSAKGLGRIVKDDAGRIIAVETDEEVDPPPLGDRLELVEEVAAEILVNPESQSWVGLGHPSSAKKPKIELIQALPNLSALVLRVSSRGEVMFLQRLISKHGDDVGAMVRDHGLNPDQRTEGEIRQAIRRAGGLEKFGASLS
ncbi:ribosome biogenesis protein Nop16 [Multifurca ochricompacta]|uniref:Nucleolar protein 16 n=1 Tax=Multifurca ochricompacta TaxID=376703 RepID=A0AAD4MB33_9AGAM|nr:ribosome biogenesis protein Nop16 [Multifurca ochricompacta]